MDEDEKQIALYQAAAECEKYEGEMVWQTFNAFLLAQTIFLAFLLQSSFGKDYVVKFELGTNLAAIFGLLICIPWMISFYRSMAFLNLRHKQAKSVEPTGWDLLTKEPVGMKHFIILPAVSEKIVKWFTTRCSVLLLIWFFIGMYITIIILSGPWIRVHT